MYLYAQVVPEGRLMEISLCLSSLSLFPGFLQGGHLTCKQSKPILGLMTSASLFIVTSNKLLLIGKRLELSAKWTQSECSIQICVVVCFHQLVEPLNYWSHIVFGGLEKTHTCYSHAVNRRLILMSPSCVISVYMSVFCVDSVCAAVCMLICVSVMKAETEKGVRGHQI